MKKNLTTLLFALVAMMMPIGAWAQDAVITGVTITVDGIEYGVGDTAVVTPTTTSLIFTVYGENFANVTSEIYIYYSQDFGNLLTNGWTIDTEKNTATYDYSNRLEYFETNITPFEVKYSNDNNVTIVNSGVYIVYDDGVSEDEKAVITGLTITVDGVEYGVGDTAVVTPNTTSLIYTVYGERLANAAESNCLLYALGSTTTLANDWIIDTEKNTATYDYSRYLVWFESTITPFEVMYSNDYRANWTNSGVYIVYDYDLSEEEKAVITGVTITVDGVEYGVGDTAVFTPNTTSLIYTVYGERFANVTSENYITYSQGLGDHLVNGWTIDTEKNTATYDFINEIEYFKMNITPYEVLYSNDNNVTEISSGVYIVYDDGVKAVITGLTITVDGVEYGVGDTAVVTPNTTSLIYTVYGERFAKVTSENFIACSQGMGNHLTNGWTIDTEKNTATYDFSNEIEYFESNITPFEVKYSNDNMKTWGQSGVYIVYDYGLSEDEKAVITGLTITVDGVEYGVGDTAVVTPNTTSLIYTVYGERFANVTSENCINYSQGYSDHLANGWTIDTEKNTATYDFSNRLAYFEINITPYEVLYSNDNNVTIVNSGVYIVYDNGVSEDEKAVITGVTITVDGIDFGVGDTAVVTPNTTSLIFTVYGENFANLTSENFITYSQGMGNRLTNDWIIDTEKNTATYDFSNALVYFESNITPFEVKYSNDNRVTRVNSGVYIVYDYGLSEEEKAVITGLTITVDGVEYGVGDTAVVTPNTTSLIFTVYGNNFKNLNANHMLYDSSVAFEVNELNGWIIDDSTNTATCDRSDFLRDYTMMTTPVEILYTNDRLKTWIESGVYLMYSEQNDEVTSLDQLIHDHQANSHKILRDGQVIILRDGKAYNLMGVAL